MLFVCVVFGLFLQHSFFKLQLHPALCLYNLQAKYKPLNALNSFGPELLHHALERASLHIFLFFRLPLQMQLQSCVGVINIDMTIRIALL